MFHVEPQEYSKQFFKFSLIWNTPRLRHSRTPKDERWRQYSQFTPPEYFLACSPGENNRLEIHVKTPGGEIHWISSLKFFDLELFAWIFVKLGLDPGLELIFSVLGPNWLLHFSGVLQYYLSLWKACIFAIIHAVVEGFSVACYQTDWCSHQQHRNVHQRIRLKLFASTLMWR